MIITLENTQKKVKLPREAQKLLVAGLNAVGKLHDLSDETVVDVTIVDDAEIQELNREYRNVDRPTDVLSFALDEGEEPALTGGPDEHLLGDIIISAETAVRQGEEYGHGLNRELAYLAIHGCLHLLGYDHMEENDKKIMRAEEEKALGAIDLSQEDILRDVLLSAAAKARKRAHAPYSGFKVGAAVLSQDGQIFTGCNIENSSYGMTVCAERVAIWNAVSAGVKKFDAIAIVADTHEPCAPCGACRQVMEEFKIRKIIMGNTKGGHETHTLKELLPGSFGAESLKKKSSRRQVAKE